MNYYARYYRQLANGQPATPRGLKTTGVQDMVFTPPPYTFWRRPHDNPMIGFMEGLQFIAGVFDQSAIARVAPHAKLELFTPQSSYGPRCGTQLQEVVDTISEDPDTRRAVIVLANQSEPLSERPCTTGLQFQVKDGGLHVTVTMRSSDAIWGMPYDVLQFGMISHVVAVCTGYAFRSMVINVGNAHIYTNTAVNNPEFTEHTFGLPPLSPNTVAAWQTWAVGLIDGITWEFAQMVFNIKKA
jgi:hypothetical protein